MEYAKLCGYSGCGKHVKIRAPYNSGSVYYNQKGFFSIVLLAICDSCYKFLLFDIGACGSESDRGILLRSEMRKAIYGQTLNIPLESKMPGINHKESLFIVRDSVFEMNSFLMNLYPKKTQ